MYHLTARHGLLVCPQVLFRSFSAVHFALRREEEEVEGEARNSPDTDLRKTVNRRYESGPVSDKTEDWFINKKRETPRSFSFNATEMSSMTTDQIMKLLKRHEKNGAALDYAWDQYLNAAPLVTIDDTKAAMVAVPLRPLRHPSRFQGFEGGDLISLLLVYSSHPDRARSRDVMGVVKKWLLTKQPLSLERFSIPELCGMLTVFGKHDESHNTSAMFRLVKAVIMKKGISTIKDATKIISVTCTGPHYDQELLKRVESYMLSNTTDLKELAPHEVSYLLSSLVRSKFRVDRILTHVDISLSEMESLESFDPRSFCYLVHSFAIGGVRMSEGLVTKVISYMDSRSKDLTPQLQTKVLWSLAVQQQLGLLPTKLLIQTVKDISSDVVQASVTAAHSTVNAGPGGDGAGRDATAPVDNPWGVNRHKINPLPMMVLQILMEAMSLPSPAGNALRNVYTKHKAALSGAVTRDGATSLMHKDVSRVLNKMGIRHENEVMLDEGYTVDIKLSSGKYDRKVVIEVDGPTHFDGKQMITNMKRRHLQKSGYTLLVIPYYEWTQVTKNNLSLRGYLKAKTAPVYSLARPGK